MATALDGRLQAKTITPSLTVDDLQRSIRFFEGLGFVVNERWEDGGVLRGVMLKAGESRLGISQDDWQKGRDRLKGQGFRIYCGTSQDVDAIARRVRDAGVTLLEEPKDQPWGGRDFAVVDPDGFTITISTGL